MGDVGLKRRRLVAANSKWNVYFDHLIDSLGNEVRDYLVIEPHATRARDVTGVAVLPVLGDRFVLLRSFRQALGAELWELPRGFIDDGEDAAQAAQRELTEETGLVCAPKDMIPLGFYVPEASTMRARGALFAAANCRGELRLGRDEIGAVSLSAVPGHALKELVDGGAIEDAGTLIAYYRYQAYRAASGR